MPYSPHRRHAVGLFSQTIQALNLLQQLYQPNLLIFFSRMLVQMQTAAAGVVNPTRSLLSLCAMLSLLNATAGLLHLLDHMAGPGKGVMLDFVGQVRTASLTRVLILDLIIYLLQIHSLTISYLNNKSASALPAVPELPYPDMLLPVSDIPEEVGPEDFDIESGLRRRKGKGRAIEEMEDEDELVWLDDDPEGDDGDVRPSERDRLLSEPRQPRKRAREPPRIASISLSHIINLIIHMPTPLPPPRSFAGATPIASPRGADASLPNTASTGAEDTISSDGIEDDEDVDDEEEDEDEDEDEDEYEDEEDNSENEHNSEGLRRNMIRRREREEQGIDVEQGEEEASHDRMPGDYWTRGGGNGG